jgi:hypothetical protein
MYVTPKGGLPSIVYAIEIDAENLNIFEIKNMIDKDMYAQAPNRLYRIYTSSEFLLRTFARGNIGVGPTYADVAQGSDITDLVFSSSVEVFPVADTSASILGDERISGNVFFYYRGYQNIKHLKCFKLSQGPTVQFCDAMIVPENAGIWFAPKQGISFMNTFNENGEFLLHRWSLVDNKLNATGTIASAVKGTGIYGLSVGDRYAIFFERPRSAASDKKNYYVRIIDSIYDNGRMSEVFSSQTERINIELFDHNNEYMQFYAGGGPHPLGSDAFVFITRGRNSFGRWRSVLYVLERQPDEKETWAVVYAYGADFDPQRDHEVSNLQNVGKSMFIFESRIGGKNRKYHTVVRSYR